MTPFVIAPDAVPSVDALSGVSLVVITTENLFTLPLPVKTVTAFLSSLLPLSATTSRRFSMPACAVVPGALIQHLRHCLACRVARFANSEDLFVAGEVGI